MGRIRKADVWLLSDRNFPERKVTLPENVVGDLSRLLAAVRQLQPWFDFDALVRAVWHYGIKAVRHRQERRIPIKVTGSARRQD